MKNFKNKNRFENLQKISERDSKNCFKELLYLEEYENKFINSNNLKKDFYGKKNLKERVDYILKKRQDELLTNSWNKLFTQKKSNSMKIKKFVFV